ncbi:MAG: class I SAM-dependent methyltransferase [Nanoarchaeota archaeon]|nr:class I SAM-dependent methyltransferase [Nanoarchaeota archaeon]
MENFRSHAKIDFETRRIKAKKLIIILKNYKDLSKSIALDIGVGAGVITTEVGKISKKVFGVDLIDERISKNNYTYKKVEGLKLPFKDNYFDVIISNQIIEHIKDKDVHINEIYRVLKKDGICYLATPNKYSFLEPHYKLLFLSMLPMGLANFYLLLFRKVKYYDVYPLSYNKLIKKISNKFIFENITYKILKNPYKYSLEKKYSYSIFKYLPKCIFYIINYLLPSWIFILKKRNIN